ncbi:MAG: porin [Nitrospinae bacterium]|nr:porin [Nitrospinota bacterium]
MRRTRNLILTVFLFLAFGIGNAQAANIFKVLEDIEIHGFVSSAYSYNFNEPRNELNCGDLTRLAICLRIFDQDDNSFKLDVGELVIMKEASEKGDIGFRVDLDYGFSIPEITQSSGADSGAGVGPHDDFDVQQGYVSYNAPIGNGLVIDFGKFITHIGSEVIEGHDGWNYNYSRSFLFGLAIPFTHTGIRASYAINDWISVMFMIANGWDNVTDNNDGKTLGFQLAVNPMDNVSILFNWAGGPENDGNGKDWRHILDLVVEIGLLDVLTFNLNFDYGIEENTSLISPGNNAEWWGFAGIVRYDVNEWFSLNFRGETFVDADGNRTWGEEDPRSQSLWEITITPEIRIHQNMVFRVEYRHDESSRPVFLEENGDFTDNQDTISFNALIHY